MFLFRRRPSRARLLKVSKEIVKLIGRTVIFAGISSPFDAAALSSPHNDSVGEEGKPTRIVFVEDDYIPAAGKPDDSTRIVITPDDYGPAARRIIPQDLARRLASDVARLTILLGVDRLHKLPEDYVDSYLTIIQSTIASWLGSTPET